MKNTLIIEEVKRLHEIMGINPKKILLESVGQAWFESLMKDIIEGAARNADGISDDILDVEAYNAIKPWIKNQFNVANPDENQIKSFLKMINDDLSSGKSLTQIGAGLDWYKLLDDVVKRNESFYIRLIDDMIKSGEFEQIADLLVSTASANKILASGPENNPKIYNSLIDNLNSLKTGIDESSMDENLKKIIKDKMGLNKIPQKSSIPDIDEAFSQIAKKIKGENIKYDQLVDFYTQAVRDPKSFNLQNIKYKAEEFQKAIKNSGLIGGVIPNVGAVVTKLSNRVKLYEILYKTFRNSHPNKAVYIISSWLLALNTACLIQKLTIVAWQLGVRSKLNTDVYKAMYGELTNLITDFGGCVVGPIGIVEDLLSYMQGQQGLDIKDEEVQNKLREMLNKDKNNPEYINFANALIQGGATKEDFDKAGFPTDELNFGDNEPETDEEILAKWKKFDIEGTKVGETGVRKEDGLYYTSKKGNVGYKYDKNTKKFD